MIADGGIKYSGDLAKAIAAGADMFSLSAPKQAAPALASLFVAVGVAIVSISLSLGPFSARTPPSVSTIGTRSSPT